MTLDRRTNSSISSIEAMEVSRTARAKISESEVSSWLTPSCRIQFRLVTARSPSNTDEAA